MALTIGSLKKQVGEYLFRKSQKKNIEKVFLEGYEIFEKTGTTPDESYQAMVSMFCLTNGVYNEKFYEKVKDKNPPVKAPASISGVLGDLNTNDFSSINKELNKDGYFVFEKKLSPEMCKRLYDAALALPTVVRGVEEKILYDPANPVSEIYRIRSADMMGNHDIQSLIADPTLINIARNYFGCEPIFDFPAMWWSTSFSKVASADAAQLYHFDMDRLKWLKIFFYINDVTEENGPHSYIRGTHKPKTKPMNVLNRGYVRVTDEELREHYPAEDFKTLCGEAGVMFAGDTKCWHKGTPLQSGHRLALELEYTTSMFGTNGPKLKVTNISPEFRQFAHDHPLYCSNIEME